MSIEQKAEKFKGLYEPIQARIHEGNEGFKKTSEDLGLSSTTPLQNMTSASNNNLKYAKSQSELVDESKEMLDSCSESIVRDYIGSIKVLGKVGADYSEQFAYLTRNVSKDLQGGVPMDRDSVNNTMISSVLDLWYDTDKQLKVDGERHQFTVSELRLENRDLRKNRNRGARRWTEACIDKFKIDNTTKPPLNTSNYGTNTDVDQVSCKEMSSSERVSEMEAHGCFEDFKK